MRSDIKRINLSKKILKIAGKTNGQFHLIGEGDKVLVGLSGGKDSLALVHTLKHIQRHAPFDFEFEACTVSYGMPGEEYTYLREHCQEQGIKHTVYETKIFDISQDAIREIVRFAPTFRVCAEEHSILMQRRVDLPRSHSDTILMMLWRAFL